MRLRPILASLIQLVLVVYLYTAMEWLFIATQRSFLDGFRLGTQIQILLLTALAIAAAALVTQAGAAVLFVLANRLVAQASWLRPAWILAALPASIATALALLLLDNFTYTVLGFGILDAGLFASLAYCFGAVLVFAQFVRRSAARWERDAGSWGAARSTVVALLLGASLASSAYVLLWGPAEWRSKEARQASLGARELPNILFMAADGVNADHLPVYGYRFATTPALTRLAGRALVAENTITNAVRTTGALTSMLTGKLPTTTRVFFPPHALAGADAFEHLPGILKELGYSTLQETTRYYADGPDLNMRGGFDEANRRVVDEGASPLLPAALGERLPTQSLFSQRLWDRITERVLHITRVEPMVDHYGLMTGEADARVYGFTDADRVDRVLEFMQRVEEPFFVHIHLMDTHCCAYRPAIRFFSARWPDRPAGERMEYYDDAILTSDWQLGRILEWLEANDRLGRTLVVYSSDHTHHWGFTGRVPLVFSFPGGAHAGRVAVTAQLLDVAPTILDFLDVETPAWMEGHSLLRAEEIDPSRPIFTVTDLHRERFSANDESLLKLVGEGPPLYGLRTFSVTVCDRWYTMMLDTGAIDSGSVKGHTGPCTDTAAPSEAEARGLIVEHLRSRGIEPAFRLDSAARLQ